MKFFKNAAVLTEDGKLNRCDLSFGERIAGFCAGDEEIPLPQNAVVLPGFLDEHVHGAGGADCMDGTKKSLSTIAQTLAKEGTTAFLATTMTQSRAATIAALEAANKYMGEKNAGARLLGVHAEGPFLSTKYSGAQPADYILPPSVACFRELFEASGKNIRLITVAPETDGAEELISYAASQGVTVSIGHSDATFEGVQNAYRAGARCVTHTFNAQRGVHHREIGVTGGAMLLDGLYAELIADGIHVSVPALRLLAKCKPQDKLILITDAMRAKGLGDGESELGGQRVAVKNGEARLSDGTLAGSVLTMNVAVKNMVEKAGLSLGAAVRCATLNPATNLGLEKDYGSIRAGKYADFAVLDERFNVLMTVRGGETIYKA